MPIEAESPEEYGYDNILYNLSESSVADFNFSDLHLPGSFPLAYSDHRGKPELRSLIASGLVECELNQVLLTHGAAAALFIIYTALLQPGDHILVVRPNYATNIAVPQAIGCDISFIDLSPENNWLPDIAAIQQAIKPNTKIISITTPHNPTGVVWPKQLTDACITLAVSKNIYLLADETYRDTGCITGTPVIASAHSCCISVSSVSKAYGLPGIRMGWLIAKDADVYEKCLAAKEMIYITNSILDEEACYAFLQQKEEWQGKVIHQVQKNFQVLHNWISNEKRLDWVRPQAGVVCFPWIKDTVALDLDKFYHLLLHTYQTMVGPGHWFDMPGRFMRIGYGWTDELTLQKGLENISRCLDESV